MDYSARTESAGDCTSPSASLDVTCRLLPVCALRSAQASSDLVDRDLTNERPHTTGSPAQAVGAPRSLPTRGCATWAVMRGPALSCLRCVQGDCRVLATVPWVHMLTKDVDLWTSGSADVWAAKEVEACAARLAVRCFLHAVAAASCCESADHTEASGRLGGLPHLSFAASPPQREALLSSAAVGALIGEPSMVLCSRAAI